MTDPKAERAALDAQAAEALRVEKDRNAIEVAERDPAAMPPGVLAERAREAQEELILDATQEAAAKRYPEAVKIEAGPDPVEEVRRLLGEQATAAKHERRHAIAEEKLAASNRRAVRVGAARDEIEADPSLTREERTLALDSATKAADAGETIEHKAIDDRFNADKHGKKLRRFDEVFDRVWRFWDLKFPDEQCAVIDKQTAGQSLRKRERALEKAADKWLRDQRRRYLGPVGEFLRASGLTIAAFEESDRGLQTAAAVRDELERIRAAAATVRSSKPRTIIDAAGPTKPNWLAIDGQMAQVEAGATAALARIAALPHGGHYVRALEAGETPEESGIEAELVTAIVVFEALAFWPDKDPPGVTHPRALAAVGALWRISTGDQPAPETWSTWLALARDADESDRPKVRQFRARVRQQLVTILL